jgi:hypothetical protein
VHAELVGARCGLALDREALGPVAGGDVCVQLAARLELGVAEEGVVSERIPDVEIDVVGIGFPVQGQYRAKRVDGVVASSRELFASSWMIASREPP